MATFEAGTPLAVVALAPGSRWLVKNSFSVPGLGAAAPVADKSSPDVSEPPFGTMTVPLLSACPLRKRVVSPFCKSLEHAP